MSVHFVSVLALVISTQLIPLKSSRDRLGRPEIDWDAIQECAWRSTLSTTDWQRQQFANLSFRLPRDFKVTKSPVVFDHGGLMWAEGDRTVSIIAGVWGPTSFDSWPGTLCRVSIAGHPIIVMEDIGSARVTIQAWYPDHPLLVTTAKRQSDLRLLRAIVLSGERQGL